MLFAFDKQCFSTAWPEPFTMETEIFKQHVCWSHTVARYVCCLVIGILGFFGDVPVRRLFDDGAKKILFSKLQCEFPGQTFFWLPNSGTFMDSANLIRRS